MRRQDGYLVKGLTLKLWFGCRGVGIYEDEELDSQNIINILTLHFGLCYLMQKTLHRKKK